MPGKEADHDARQSFQEMVELVELPSGSAGDSSVKRYLGTRAAWVPGSDLFTTIQSIRDGDRAITPYKAAFGGHVYAQSALAVCRAMAAAWTEKGAKTSALPDVHVCF